MDAEKLETIWRIINTGGLLAIVVYFLIYRKKHEAETRKIKLENEGIIVSNHENNLKIIQEYNRELLLQMDTYQRQINILQKNKTDNDWIIQQLKRSSEECALKQMIAELEMDQLKKHNQFEPVIKFNVFVLDDDSDVLSDFRNKFSRSSVLNFHGFSTVNEFMRRVRMDRPPVVVIDYRLDGGNKTAEDVINMLGYEPDIFVMSGLGSYEYKLPKQKKIRFVVKDEGIYVYRIVKDIIQLLLNRIA